MVYLFSSPVAGKIFSAIPAVPAKSTTKVPTDRRSKSAAATIWSAAATVSPAAAAAAAIARRRLRQRFQDFQTISSASGVVRSN